MGNRKQTHIFDRSVASQSCVNDPPCFWKGGADNGLGGRVCLELDLGPFSCLVTLDMCAVRCLAIQYAQSNRTPDIPEQRPNSFSPVFHDLSILLERRDVDDYGRSSDGRQRLASILCKECFLIVRTVITRIDTVWVNA
jgi:hypothetical protein